MRIERGVIFVLLVDEELARIIMVLVRDVEQATGLFAAGFGERLEEVSDLLFVSGSYEEAYGEADHQLRPEEPNPPAMRRDSASSSTTSTVPVRTGYGIRLASLSPARISCGWSLRFSITTLISPR